VHVGKGQAKQEKIYVILLFLCPCVVFAGIEMQKGKTGRGEGSRGARALLSLNGKYNFYFRFGLCVL
jgi:hypothetical protein